MCLKIFYRGEDGARQTDKLDNETVVHQHVQYKENVFCSVGNGEHKNHLRGVCLGLRSFTFAVLCCK